MRDKARATISVHARSTEANATHLLFTGDGWVEATRCYHDEWKVDGGDGFGWHFRDVGSAARWLSGC